MSNTRNYRTPTSDDDADVPYWNDLLAQDVATDVDNLEATTPTLADRTPIDDSIGGIIVDDDRRTWLDFTADGGPTAYATAKILERIGTGLAPTVDRDDTDIAGGIIVDDDRTTWLTFTADGGPTAYAARKIGASLGLTPRSALPDICCWGDSMTAGAGGITPVYPTILATLTGRNVVNAGSGGETSVTIAARTNALPLLFIPRTGQIPASGSVEIDLEPIGGVLPAPLVQAWAGYTDGTALGIPVTLSRNTSTGVYSITRKNPGAAVTANRPIAYYSTDAETRRAMVNVFMLGANGPDHPRPLNDTRAAVNRILGSRYLVVSRPNGNDAEDADYFAEFGRHYFSVRKYMVRYGLADAGITPTAQDEADIAAGKVPSSLRIDGIHWTAKGYEIMANLVYTRLKELEFI